MQTTTKGKTMQMKDIKVGREYAQAHSNYGAEHHPTRVRVTETGVLVNLSWRKTGRGVRWEVLDEETGKVVGTGQGPAREIREPWADWVETQKRKAEHQRQADEARKAARDRANADRALTRDMLRRLAVDLPVDGVGVKGWYGRHADPLGDEGPDGSGTSLITFTPAALLTLLTDVATAARKEN